MTPLFSTVDEARQFLQMQDETRAQWLMSRGYSGDSESIENATKVARQVIERNAGAGD